MKKSIFTICGILLAGMLAVSLTACSVTSLEEDTPQAINKLVFKGKVTYGSDISTKAVKTGWASGDKVYAFFGGLDAEKYLTLTYTGGSPAWEATPSAALSDVADLGTSGTMYVVFFPFGTIDIASDGAGGVTFSSGGKPVNAYYMCGNDAYTVTVSSGTAVLESTVSVNIPDDYVYFFVNKDGSDFNADDTYFLTADGFQPVACTGFSGGTFVETAGTLGDPVWGYAYGSDGIAFSGKIDNSWNGTNSHNIILYTGAQPYPLKYMIKTAALTSHASVNLKNGWTECKFRGHGISPGVLTTSGTLTDGTEPFTDVKEGPGVTSNKIEKPSSLPDGWSLPAMSDWNAAINGTVEVPIKVIDYSTGSVTNTFDDAAPFALVKIDSNKDKVGLLLIRDGARISNHITIFGLTGINDISETQLNELLSQGCTIVPKGEYWITDVNNDKVQVLKIDIKTNPQGAFQEATYEAEEAKGRDPKAFARLFQ